MSTASVCVCVCVCESFLNKMLYKRMEEKEDKGKKKRTGNCLLIKKRGSNKFNRRAFFNCQKKISKLLIFYVHLVTQSCLTHCNILGCSPPASSVHGIFQARILEWVVISFSRVSFLNPGIEPISYISCTAGRFFTTEPSWKPKLYKRNLISGNETKIKIAYRHQNASPA